MAQALRNHVVAVDAIIAAKDEVKPIHCEYIIESIVKSHEEVQKGKAILSKSALAFTASLAKLLEHLMRLLGYLSFFTETISYTLVKLIGCDYDFTQAPSYSLTGMDAPSKGEVITYFNGVYGDQVAKARDITKTHEPSIAFDEARLQKEAKGMIASMPKFANIVTNDPEREKALFKKTVVELWEQLILPALTQSEGGRTVESWQSRFKWLVPDSEKNKKAIEMFTDLETRAFLMTDGSDADYGKAFAGIKVMRENLLEAMFTMLLEVDPVHNIVEAVYALAALYQDMITKVHDILSTIQLINDFADQH